MIYKDFPEFNYHIRILIERQATLAEECLRFFRNGQASDRYKWFAERFPELIQRVPGRHLASYIGVTESTLSRIKRKKI